MWNEAEQHQIWSQPCGCCLSAVFRAALPSVLGSWLGGAGCCHYWTSFRWHSGSTEPSLSASEFPWEWRGQSGWHHHYTQTAVDSFQPHSQGLSPIPDLLPAFDEWLLPRGDRAAPLQGESCTGLYKYSTQHLCLGLPNSALSHW